MEIKGRENQMKQSASLKIKLASDQHRALIPLQWNPMMYCHVLLLIQSYDRLFVWSLIIIVNACKATTYQSCLHKKKNALIFCKNLKTNIMLLILKKPQTTTDHKSCQAYNFLKSFLDIYIYLSSVILIYILNVRIKQEFMQVMYKYM